MRRAHSWVGMIPRVRGGLLAALAAWGACFFCGGCVSRYATIIATSTPPLARVTVAHPPSAAGPTPAYLHEQTRFFVLFPKRRSYTLTFDHEQCTPVVNRVLVTNWGTSKEDMPGHVTSTVGRLKCDVASGSQAIGSQLSDSSSPPFVSLSGPPAH